MKRYTKGFTLIELLVVIAIIGILASVVLVSLQSARKKGNDSRVISDVQQIRTLLETNYNGTAYPDLTGANNNVPLAGAGNLKTLEDDIAAQQNAGGLTYSNGAGGTYLILKLAAENPGKSYAIFAKLPSSGATFCMDSTGATKNNATFPNSFPTAPVCQ